MLLLGRTTRANQAPTAPGAAKASRTPTLALAGLSTSVLLASLGTSISNVALPTLAQTFGATFQQVQWIVLAYLLAITTLVVSVGRLGDMIGKRRLLSSGLVVFTTASIACGLAENLSYLVAARARLVAWCAYWLWMTAVACTVLVGLAIALPDQVRPPHVPGRVCRACHIHAGSRRALLHAVHCQASDPSSGLLVASCSAFLHATHLCKPGWMDCAVASATGSAGVLHSAAWPFHTAGQRNRRVRRGSAQRQGQRQD